MFIQHSKKVKVEVKALDGKVAALVVENKKCFSMPKATINTIKNNIQNIFNKLLRSLVANIPFFCFEKNYQNIIFLYQYFYMLFEHLSLFYNKKTNALHVW